MEGKIVKVCEPSDNESTWCERCDQYYCSDCVSFELVDFNIEENIFDDRPDLKPFVRDWVSEYVCPYCYNQLADKKNNEVTKNE